MNVTVNDKVYRVTCEADIRALVAKFFYTVYVSSDKVTHYAIVETDSVDGVLECIETDNGNKVREIYDRNPRHGNANQIYVWVD